MSLAPGLAPYSGYTTLTDVLAITQAPDNTILRAGRSCNPSIYNLRSLRDRHSQSSKWNGSVFNSLVSVTTNQKKKGGGMHVCRHSTRNVNKKRYCASLAKRYETIIMNTIHEKILKTYFSV